MQDIKALNANRLLNILVGLTVFILPSVVVTVGSGATTIYFFLFILGLVFGWKTWGFLLREERVLLSCFLLFTIFVGFSFINSSDINESFSSYEKYIRFSVFVPIYILVRRFALELGPWLIWGLVIGCAVMGLVAVFQYHILDAYRPSGARNAARFGLTAMTFFLLLVLAVMFEWRKTIFFALSLISLVIIMYAIGVNQTRSAMLSVFPFIGMLAYYYRNNIDKKTALLLFLAFLIIAAIFVHPSSKIAQVYMQGYLELKALMQDPIGNYYTSWGLRPHLLHAGWLVFLQSPIFGTGLSDYAYDVQLLMESGMTLINDEFLVTSPHNIYVNVLAEAGIVGFIGLLLAVCFAPLYCYVSILKRRLKHKRLELYALSGITVSICFLLFGMFHTWININNSISIFLILHLVFVSNSYQILREKFSRIES